MCINLIETVLGKIHAKDMGNVMCHEHLAMDLSPVRGDNDSVFSDKELILNEILLLKECGCGTIIEVTSQDMGRDIEALQYYSKQSGMHIVASTGFYLEPYHTEFAKEATVDDIADFFKKELSEGIEDTGIKAGLIAEIATSTNCVKENEKKVFLAAAKAAVETKCAVSTHCDMSTQAHEQLDMLLSSGMAADKIILGHMDLTSDTDYHISLLKRGTNLAFDTISKIAYISDEKRAENLIKLLNNGWEDHILLSQDVSRLSYLTTNGGKGYTAVMKYFIPMLEKMGVAQNQIEKMIVHNPARILDR